MRVSQALCLLGLLAILGCSDDGPVGNPPPVYSSTDLANAQILAQCVTGDIRAPQALSIEIATELTLIKRAYAGAHPEILDIEMAPPWAYLQVAFDETTFDDVKNGQYDAWDMLNSEYEVSEIKPSTSGLPFAYLYFAATLNLCALGDLYADLPGVIEASPNWTWGNRRKRINVVTVGSHREYLFLHGYGDCPSGCINRDYRYFRFADGSTTPEFVGMVSRRDADPPAWWSDAYDLFNGCACSIDDPDRKCCM